MSKLFKTIYQPQFLLIIILVQTLGIARLLNSTITDYYTASPRVLAETIADSDQEYKNCLQKPVAQRESCAREIGQNLLRDASLTSSQKIQNCMKLRPVFYRYCFEELRQSP